MGEFSVKTFFSFAMQQICTTSSIACELIIKFVNMVNDTASAKLAGLLFSKLY